VPYDLENAMFQWEEGERRVAEADAARRPSVERAVGRVLGELRRRLGGEFGVDELTELYARDTEWAAEVARAELPGTDSSWVVDAAFWRYAREAYDFAGGRLHRSLDRG
jgi:hypothetical protein